MNNLDTFLLSLLLILFIMAIIATLFFVICILYGICWLITIPLRRKERISVFLDLAEHSLAQGKKVEDTMVSLDEISEKTFGKEFADAVSYIQDGEKLGSAIQKADMLPEQITKIIQAGEETGDIAKALTACRKMLEDSKSQVQGVYQYLAYLLYVPVIVFIFGYLQGSAKFFHRLLVDYQVSPKDSLFRYNLELYFVITIIFIFFLSILWFIPYFFQARLKSSWFGCLQMILPWCRKRLYRDFSFVLSILLDAGMPETKAVSLAADSTRNHSIIHRASKVIHALENGVKLPDAIACMDKSGEFRWRMQTAHHGKVSFTEALSGWHESLSARAYQQEQASAQLITTLLILCNGIMVGIVVVGFFQMLIHLIKGAMPW